MSIYDLVPRRRSLIWLVGWFLLLVGTGTWAQAPSRLVDFDIPAQAMSTALVQFGKQAGLQVVSSGQDLGGISARAVKGRLTVSEAIGLLLEGTRLVASFNGGDTLVIKPAAEPARGRSSAAPSAVALSSDARNDRDIHKGESIVVTSQRREERIQNVPISISVLRGDDLDKSTVTGVTEALSRVPGVGTTATVQGGGSQLAVRGVSAGSSIFSGSSAVSYYLDGVPFGLVRTQIVPDPNAYDMERIEVLRGPQGTLYGASALNGVVRLLTKEASLDQFDFKARSSAASTKGGAASFRGDLAVNVPVVEDRLAFRAVVGYEDLGGWVERPNKDDANDAKLRNLRLKVNAQATDSLAIGLSAWRSRSDYGAPSVSNAAGQNGNTAPEPITTDYDAYGVKINYDAPAFSVTSTTSYLDFRNDGFLDFTQAGLANTVLQTTFDSKVLAQELNVNSRNRGPWEYTFGGIYRDAKDRLFQVRRQYVAPTIQDNVSKSFAAFGELARAFLDGRVKLTGGLRYFEDRVSGREISRLTGVPAAQLINTDNKFDAVTPRGVLTWYPNPNLTFYSSYAEGFRSGYPQLPAVLVVAPTFRPVDADRLRNYEVGAKGTLWGGRVMFEAAAYYIDWHDVQQSLQVEVAPGVRLTTGINGRSASGPGFEIAAMVRPAFGLEVGANLSWNDLTQDADVVAANGVRIFQKGERLNFSPKLTAGLRADYAFPLAASGYNGRLSASINHTSSLASRVLAGTNVTKVIGDPITIGRVSFAAESPKHWRTTLYVDNINNERGSPLPSTDFPDNDARIRPRTVGVQVEYRY